jgi:HlyD family secretion protein
MRHLSTIAWIVVLALGGFAAYRFGPWFNDDANAKPAFDTVSLARGPIVSKVTASGTLSALVTVQVGSQVSGRIKEIHADYNSEVKKGQVIAKIDPQLFNASLEQARANQSAAQGELLKAKVQAADAARQLVRIKSLAERKLVAEAELDTAQATTEMAQAGVAAANGRLQQTKAAYHQAQVNLTYTTITSPIDGVVISRSVDVGQTVAASLQSPILFTIAEDLRKMHVDTSVAEADVGKLEDGMKATFYVDAYPTERFEGRVRQIRNAPTTVQNVVTYDAVIDVDNPDLKLRPGMTANVTFVYAERPNALRVPNAALRFKPTPEMLGQPAAGTAGAQTRTNVSTSLRARGAGPSPLARSQKRTVYRLEGGKPTPVEITIGITDGSHTELVEGALEEGSQLITDTAGGSKPVTPAGGSMPMRRVL